MLTNLWGKIKDSRIIGLNLKSGYKDSSSFKDINRIRDQSGTEQITLLRSIFFAAMGLITLILSSFVIFKLTDHNPWELKAMFNPPYEVPKNILINEIKDKPLFLLTSIRVSEMQEKLEQCKEILLLLREIKDEFKEWEKVEDLFDRVFLLSDIGNESSLDDLQLGLRELDLELEGWKMEISDIMVGLDDKIVTRELRLLISSLLNSKTSSEVS